MPLLPLLQPMEPLNRRMGATLTMDANKGDDQRGVIALHPEQEKERTTDMVGMIIFLGSWAIMFAALFFTFGMIRVRASVWPPPGIDPLPLTLPGINTALIIASSFILHYAGKAFVRGQIHLFRKLLWATILTGATFMALQMIVWLDLWQSGLQLSTGLYGAFFYLLTVFHGLHVLVGLGLLGWLVPQVLQAAGTPKRGGRIRLASLFWHFVDVVWVMIFVLVYVL
jgi:heme/copper-type cytochrome/quinol oxidase subunit 3